jgi:hypothetical protein
VKPQRISWKFHLSIKLLAFAMATPFRPCQCPLFFRYQTVVQSVQVGDTTSRKHAKAS